MIYHIAARADWDAAQTQGAYVTPSLAAEGFIHCSTAQQVAPVGNAFYRGRKDLALLQIDEAKLTAELKWEAPAGPPAAQISESDLFPHVFGAINLNAIAAVLDFEPDSAAGTFSPPKPVTL
ncbi:MAG: DUF952 domain-containing protein [Anaerolineales bacterium]|nr:DUF952 domain-containing protein [Anaerolineales bacterium]